MPVFKKLGASVDAGIWLFILLVFTGAILWAKSGDPFERVWFSIETSPNSSVKGVAVLPKPKRKVPVVIYVYGSHGSLVSSGTVLRQLAGLGMAGIAIEYDQADPEAFDREFAGLLRWLPEQKWADTNSMAWIGWSLGAQRTLRFLLQNPASQPRLYVRVGGGWLEELEEKAFLPFHPPLSTVLLVHGERDEVFPVSDVARLGEVFKKNGLETDIEILPGKGHAFGTDRPLVSRCIGEYVKSRLTPSHPLPELPITRGFPFLLYIAPSLIWGGYWFYVRQKSRPKAAVQETPLTRYDRFIGWMTVGLAVAAMLQIAIQLGTPRMEVSGTTLSIARKFFIAPTRIEDFDDLASKEYWRTRKLNTLLTHVELAHYNAYELINWKLDRKIYQDYVLSPVIDSESDTELNWRRSLWEYFYPRIRKENSTDSAAEIIVRNLRECVTVVSLDDVPLGVESIWSAQVTNERGFERIYVAALRSVGVPARLNQANWAEFWTGSEWRPAPRPLITTWM